MSKYVVQSRLKHNGELYEKGDEFPGEPTPELEGVVVPACECEDEECKETGDKGEEKKEEKVDTKKKSTKKEKKSN